MGDNIDLLVVGGNVPLCCMLSGQDWHPVEGDDFDFLEGGNGDSVMDDDTFTVGPSETVCSLVLKVHD